MNLKKFIFCFMAIITSQTQSLKIFAAEQSKVKQRYVKGVLIDEPDDKLCNFNTVVNIKGNTIKACNKNAEIYLRGKYEICAQADSWMGYISDQARKCNEKVMNYNLDSRLQKLKVSKVDQFNNEMLIQKYYLEMKNKTCNPIAKCDGTAAELNFRGCLNSFAEYRAAQADLINQGNLNFRKPFSKKEDNIKWNKSALDFISGLCSLPNEVWKDKAPPVNCEKLALKEMSDAGLTPFECD